MREDAPLCACACGEALAPDKRGRYATFRLNHDKRKPVDNYTVEDWGYATPCHIWQGNISPQGYGKMKGGISTHVWFWEQAHGPVPAGKEIDHLCRVRRCCNPEHLEPVTRAENSRRGNRSKLTEKSARLVKQSKETERALAMRLGVHRSTINQVRRGITWKDVV